MSGMSIAPVPHHRMGPEHPPKNSKPKTLPEEEEELPEMRPRTESTGSRIERARGNIRRMSRQVSTQIKQRYQGMTPQLALTAVTVVIGTTFLFGYNMVVINNPKRVLEKFYRNESYPSRQGNESAIMPEAMFRTLWSFTAAIYSIGILTASFVTHYLADKFGRKKTMMGNSITVFVGCLMMGLSRVAMSYEMIIIGRLVFGMAAGFASVATIFFMEISPRNLRGAMGGLYEFGFATSMLISQLLGLPEALGTDAQWPLLLCMTAFTSFFQLCALPFAHESPRYLLCHEDDEQRALEDDPTNDNAKRESKAIEALKFYRNTTEENLKFELVELRREAEAQKHVRHLSMWEIIKDPTLRNALWVSLAVHLSLQLGGVIPVLYFSTHIFSSGGTDYGESAKASLGIGGVKVIMNLCSMFTIEKVGRRLPELVGIAGQALMLILLTVTMHQNFQDNPDYDYMRTLTIVFTIVYIAFNTFGPATICFMITPELFQENARPKAVSLSFMVNFTANFIVGLTFLDLKEVIHSYVFLIYAVCSIFLFIYIYLYLPETRRRPIDDIVNEFKPKWLKEQEAKKAAEEGDVTSPLKGAGDAADEADDKSKPDESAENKV